MRNNRLWVYGAILVMIGIIAGGWLIGVAPQLAVTASTNSEHTNVMAANARDEILLAKLKLDYQNIDALKNQLSTLQASVPTSADIPSVVTELNTLANARGLTLKSITVSDAKPYTPTTPGVAQTGGKSAKAPQTNPKITSANFVVIPMQITVNGDYSKVLDFVNDVQLGRRLFLVSTLSRIGETNSVGAKGTRTTSRGSQKVDSSLGGYIYVLLNNG